MTKEELFATVTPLAKATDAAGFQGLLETVWNHGAAEGLREAREMIAKGFASTVPSSATTPEGKP